MSVSEPETSYLPRKYGPKHGNSGLRCLVTRVNLTYPVCKLRNRRERHGTGRNTPPTVSRLSPTCRTREASQGMRRLMGSRRGVNALRKANALGRWRKGRSSPRTGKPSTRWVKRSKRTPQWRRPLAFGNFGCKGSRCH